MVPPSDISRTNPLIRLVLNQIGRRLTEKLHAKNRRHRLLLMLDEFPALGRLAAGWNTEEAVVSFLSHIVGISRAPSTPRRPW